MVNGKSGLGRKFTLAVFTAAAVPLFLSAVGCSCPSKPSAAEEKPKAAAPAPEHPKAEHPQ